MSRLRPAEIVADRLSGHNEPDQLVHVAEQAAKGFLLERDSSISAARRLEESQDYWLGAWLAAACARPLSVAETAALTQAMAMSGEVIQTRSLPQPVVDKHSTGGVGDKTTLILLPILAACGLSCLKMSGKGLGFTGGTIDKLASVPGFSSDLSPDQMVEICEKGGIALAGQNDRLAPADGKLYQLRDVTGTVASIPLIVASILSKKIAGGANLIGLDVKAGCGGIMGNDSDAVELARWLVDVGRALGLDVHAAVTDMDQPLGRMVGNALEVKEAAGVIRGQGDPRLTELCVRLAASTLERAGHTDPIGSARRAISTGTALEKAKTWFTNQGGDPRCLEYDDWGTAALVTSLKAPNAGFVQRVNARSVGEACVLLGAGRTLKADPIDPTVGLEVLVQPGDRLDYDHPVFRVHHNRPLSDELTGLLLEAVTVGGEPPAPRPLILTEL